FQGLAPDERPPAQEEVLGQGTPAPQPVDQPGPLDQVHRRRHEAWGLQRVLALGLAANLGQLDELRLADSLVPERDAGVGRSEVKSPGLFRHWELSLAPVTARTGLQRLGAPGHKLR